MTKYGLRFETHKLGRLLAFPPPLPSYNSFLAQDELHCAAPNSLPRVQFQKQTLEPSVFYLIRKCSLLQTELLLQVR